ncbi:MAG: pteridine-dependent deoxygenase [Dokdonella sp.]
MPRLRLSYSHDRIEQVLADPTVLAVFAFSETPARHDDARYVRVSLTPIGDAPLEVWRGSAAVESGIDGSVRWSSDGDYLFFAIEVDERAAGGLDAAAEQAYRDIGALLARKKLSGDTMAQVLRLWNYLDAINEGEGDEERYRHFCSGRARGIVESARNGFSAATAIGRRDGIRVLQVYGLGARIGGVAIENPRQVSAWRYPREYGPTAPTFARATRTASGQLLVSGTASVVGHASQHVDDTQAQIIETLVNLEHLFEATWAADVPERGAASTLLKAYVRDTDDAAQVGDVIGARFPDLAGLLMLAGDICRRELRVEVDGISG